MKMLDRKLVRDMLRLKGQLLAIALVLACGIATLVMSQSVMRALAQSQSDYYQNSHFADVFAALSRAPLSVARDVLALPSVRRIQMRVAVDVRLDVEGFADSAIARLVSVAPGSDPRLNQLVLRRGRWLTPGQANEVLASEAFVEAHQLAVGDNLRVVVNGRWMELVIVGVVLSPEYIFQIREGAGIPDNKRFAVLWMNYDELAPAVDLQGAFNSLAVGVERGSSEPEIIAALDRVLEPYGGQGAHGRGGQLSHRYTTDAIVQLRSMAVIPPAIFLAVAAFLVHLVLRRLVDTQREQISVLRAFGFTRFEIGLHYLQLVTVLVTVGVAVGVAVGYVMAGLAADNYRTVYRFPTLEPRLDLATLLGATAIAATVSVLGAGGAVRRAMRLQPAEGMRPEAPPSYHESKWRSLAAARFLSQPTRMILRHVLRRRWKSALSCLGIALSVAVMILGCFVQDAIEYVIDYEFHRTRHQQVTVTFNQPLPARLLDEVRHWPGVLECEPFRIAPARVALAHHKRSVSLTGLSAAARLFAPGGLDERPATIHGGVALSEKLADVLDVGLGDSVSVELQSPRRTVHQLDVVALITDYSGLNAYMDSTELERLIGGRGCWSGVLLTHDATQTEALCSKLRATPRVATFSVKQALLENFFETSARNLMLMRAFNIAFASVIAVGVVYNTARISLAERTRELAVLRALGFSRGTVAYVLLGELALLTIAAIPLGLVLGLAFAALSVTALSTETQRVPLVVDPSTYALAVLMVVSAAMASGWILRRHVDQLPFLAILKAKD